MYWMLYPFFGPNWGAGIAAFMMYVGFPSLFLLKWHKRSISPFIKACNYVLSAIVLGLLGWVIYGVTFNGLPVPNSIGLIFIYGYLAIYFIKNGYMPYQTKKVPYSDGEIENT